MTKDAFYVTNEILYPNRKIGKSTFKDQSGRNNSGIALGSLERIIGQDPEILKNIEKKLGLAFVSENEDDGNVCMANSPEVRDEFKEGFSAKDLFNFLYAVLHSPHYLEKYRDFSKNDFFTVPYPNNQKRFWKLARLGAQLRQLHRLESPKVDKYIDDTTDIMKKIAEIENKI